MHNAILALTSALVFTAALPNEVLQLGNPLLGVMALVPLYIALHRAEDTRQAARLGALFGGVSTFTANYWLMNYGDFSVWTIGGTTIAYALFGAMLGVFVWRFAQTQPSYRPFLLATVWTAYEYLKSVGFLGYPWGLSAYPLNTLTVMTQIADVTGVWGLCFLAGLANALIAETAHLRDRANQGRCRGYSGGTSRSSVAGMGTTYRSAAMFAVLVALTLGYGILRLNAHIPISGRLDMVLVQQNADSWNVEDVEGPILVAQAESERGIAARPEDPDLIVWSETSLRYAFEGSRSWYDRHPTRQPFSEFLRRLPAPLLTGSPLYHEGRFHNAALLLTPEGAVLDWYGKQHLVPFAENIPFWDVPVVQAFFTSLVGLQGVWSPGPGYRLIELPESGIRVGTPICFEDAFGYLCRNMALAGADVFINLTNNSWSRTDSAQIQHFVAARFRAIETRRTLVRSTNAGYTAVVSPWGTVTASLPMFTTDFLRVTVPVYRPSRRTPYLIYGDLFAQLLVLVVVVCLAVWNDPRRKRPGTFESSLGS